MTGGSQPYSLSKNSKPKQKSNDFRDNENTRTAFFASWKIHLVFLFFLFLDIFVLVYILVSWEIQMRNRSSINVWLDRFFLTNKRIVCFNNCK